MTGIIKSPLRYPGGKSRAIQRMLRLVPDTFDEYREPFVGGGSFFICLRQKYPNVKMWINDLNTELFCFWTCAQEDSVRLAHEVMKIKVERANGRELFYELLGMDTSKMSEFERAVRFFVLNRITFSGVVEAGGYSEGAFIGRFTKSSIERLALLGKILEGVKITNLDYKELLRNGDRGVFTFLDPPYFVATKSKLYGRNGVLHETFDHLEFAEEMKGCRHSWLITYDDSPEIRQNFYFAHIYRWELQYGMNNYKQGRAEKGAELFISNYPLPIGHEASPALTTNGLIQCSLW
jgi:DNA adenine methylase